MLSLFSSFLRNVLNLNVISSMSPTPQPCRGEYALVNHHTFQSRENRAQSSPCSKTNVSFNLVAVGSFCCLVAMIGFYAGRYSCPTHQSVIQCKCQPPEPNFETPTHRAGITSREPFSHLPLQPHLCRELPARGSSVEGYFASAKWILQSSYDSAAAVYSIGISSTALSSVYNMPVLSITD